MGGGTIRAAAKAAVFGGYRSPGFYATAQRGPPAKAASVAPPTVERGPTVSLLASEVPRHSEASHLSPIQRPSSEIDDWELTGWPEDGGLVRDSPTPAPRLVFGRVPTMEEAMEATSDLKDAVEKVYFSSTPTASATINSSSGHLDLAKHDALAIVPAMPSDVIQAFTFLHRSPQAQEVVASLASDHNVWNAVMMNEKVMEFYRTHQSITYQPEQEDDSVSYVAENEHTDTSWKDATKSVFEDLAHNIKVKVEEIVSNISDFFQDLFGASTRSSSTSREFPESSNTGFAVGASFFALAIAAIMVILVKRG